MHGAEGDVDDAAGASALGFAVVVELQCALLDDDQLGVLDLVQRGGTVPAGCIGLMGGDGFARSQSAPKDTRLSEPFGECVTGIWS